MGLTEPADLFEDWGGRSENWLRAADGRWFFLTPDGSFYEWDQSQTATGVLLDVFDATYYDDPALLYDAQPVSEELEEFDELADQWEDDIFDDVFATAVGSVLDGQTNRQVSPVIRKRFSRTPGDEAWNSCIMRLDCSDCL